MATTPTRLSTLARGRNSPGAVAVSRIFLSHSSTNNTEAVALRDWLKREGWEDVFLDVDPDRGIAAGERWERALNAAASGWEALLFLVSRDSPAPVLSPQSSLPPPTPHHQ